MRTHLSSEIEPKLDGRSVTIGGWVQTVRQHGALNFLILRDSTGTIQITAKKGEASETVLSTISKLGKEWVILVHGKVRSSKQAPRGVEIIPDAIDILNQSEAVLPLDINVDSNLDTRLNWRFLDLRNPKTKAVFQIQSVILQAFREFCIKEGAFELQPPVIIGSASEGGAALFAIPYFDREAFLAQSPQLYKQMGAISLEKVFAVMPVFRAEPHETPVHLNEVRQLDMEIAFVDDEGGLGYLERAFAYIIKSVVEKCAEELKLLERKLNVPSLPIKRVTYTEAVEMLKKSGEIIEWGDDFTKGQEKKLVALVGEEVFFIKEWPTAVRAFYSIPFEDNPAICRAYDMIYNGLEISSGAQRIHIPELLIKQLKAKDLNPDNFKFYVDCFRYGAPPHAGWSLGLERLTMQVVGASNIRECTMWPRDRTRISP